MGNTALKTYMLATMRNEREEREERRGGGNDVESRFRDRRGREHYDNGRFAPMRNEYGGNGNEETRNNSREYGNYERYPPTRGNYESPQQGYGERERMAYNQYPPENRRRSEGMRMGYVEPIRMGEDEEEPRRKWTITENNGGQYMEPRYETEYNRDGMRRVMGFGGTSYVEHPRMDEMSPRSGKKMPGHASAKEQPILTREMAEEWMENLQNEDGTMGPHWNLEDIKGIIKQRGLQVDPIRLWVAMNAEYSDNVMVNRKYGVDKQEYYLETAIAKWLNDKDAVDDKQAAYFMHIVKH